MEGRNSELESVDGALTPLHPDYVKVLRIRAAILSVPFLIAAVIVEGAGFVPLGALIVPVLLAAAFLIARMPLRRYRARGYDLGADRLRIVRGLLWRIDTVVPFGRVQHIDLHQGPLERAFGLASLTVRTAGTHNASVSLPGLTQGDAAAMREAIRGHIVRHTQ